jgi:hypothetical protein
VEWLEEPVDRTVKQGTVDEVTFTCKLSVKGKKAKWYIRNQVGPNPEFCCGILIKKAYPSQI